MKCPWFFRDLPWDQSGSRGPNLLNGLREQPRALALGIAQNKTRPVRATE
jgi:hypothetical protein